MPTWLGCGSPAYATCTKAIACSKILLREDMFYRPQGAAPSRWIDCNEFEKFAEQYGRSELCIARGGAHGLRLETPFGPDTVLVEFRTDEPHPELGHGLLITLHLPLVLTFQEAADEAFILNHLEARSWTDVPQSAAGSLTCREARRLSHIQLSFRMRCTDRDWSSASLHGRFPRELGAPTKISRSQGRLHVGNSAGQISDLRSSGYMH